MPDDATLWDLVTAERIAIEDVGAAIDVYLAEPTTQNHPIGPDHSLDLAAAVAAHAFASATVVDPDSDEPARSIGRRDPARDQRSADRAIRLSAATDRPRRR
jgi:hypothetical protein